MVDIRRYPTKYHKLKHKLYSHVNSNNKYKKLRRKYIHKKYSTYIDKPSMIWINPNKITYMLMDSDFVERLYYYGKVGLHCADKGRFNPYFYSGVEMGGNWDTFVKPHKYDRVYRGLKEYMKNNIPFEDTEYAYHYELRSNTYQNKEYYDSQIKITKDLINNIKENGFKTRIELGQLDKSEPAYLAKKQWPITVNIGRNGDYIFNNTAHNRLAISKLLDLDEIPVLPVVKHKKFKS